MQRSEPDLPKCDVQVSACARSRDMSASTQGGCGQRLYFGNLDPQVLHARGAAHSRLLHLLLPHRR